MALTPSWTTDDSPIEDPFGYGARAVAWLRRLKHPKNPAMGNPFQLDPWQERVILRLYGPRYTEDKFNEHGVPIERKGARIVRRVCLLLPRGSRKTSLCAAITLLHLVGPESIAGDVILSAASAHEQALELYNEATLIGEFDPRLRSNLKMLKSKSVINCPPRKTTYKAIAADGRVQHGKTPRLVIADELHVWKGIAGRDLWGALDSALVKTPDTLMIVATTAGRGQDNLAWEFVSHAMKVQKGEIDDPSTLPVIYAAEAEDNWEDPELWNLVSPGLRHGYPDLPGLIDKARKAKNSPPDLDNFKQYNLNVWADKTASPFVDMAVYDQGASDLDLTQLEGLPCWLGVDLSSSGDLTVIVAAFRDGTGYIVVPWFFCPAENLRQRQEQSGAPYVRWAAEGLITATPGNVVDFRTVEDTIRDLCDRFDVQEIAFDPAMARNTLNNLLDDGLPAIEHRQGSLSMMPAIAELERAILAGRFHHGGHEILRWTFSNVEIETNSHGHKTRLHKGKRHLSIDGAIAAAMAVNRASAGGSAESGSLYDDPNWQQAVAAFA